MTLELKCKKNVIYFLITFSEIQIKAILIKYNKLIPFKMLMK